eukprot:g11473.t1
MMHAEKKRLAAAFVDGALPAKPAAAAAAAAAAVAAASAEEGSSLISTQAAEPTFAIWSQDPRKFCTECEDTESTVLCQDCDEVYCNLCWAALHRRGQRAKHETTRLGSKEDLTPPPQAVEGSGWLAGVWPSQKPKPKTGPQPAASSPSPAAAETFSCSTASQTPARATLNGTLKGRDAHGATLPPTGVAAPPAAAELNGNASGSTISRGAGPQAEEGGSGKMSATGATVVVAAMANGPRQHAAPAALSHADAGGARPSAGNQNGDGNWQGEGNGSAARALPKKPKLNGHASAAAATAATPPAAPATAGASAAAADATTASLQSACKGSRRPDGYEGPLCPSGDFFSKPQTPPPTPTPPPPPPSVSRSNGAKRPRSPSLPKEGTEGEPPGIDKAVAAAPIAGEASRSTSNGGGLGLDKNGGGAGAAEGRGHGQGRSLDEISTAAAAGETGRGRGFVTSDSGSAVGRVSGSNGGVGLHKGQGSTNGCSGLTAAASAAAAGGRVEAGPPAEDVDGTDNEAPLLSAAAISAAARAGGRVDVELPLPLAAASAKNGGGAGGAGGAAVGGDVDPVREATVAEKRSLADLKRRATNIPLRLDPRERAILGVLEGSLHHMQYTDAVDRIMRGGRLSCVLENLKIFFTGGGKGKGGVAAAGETGGGTGAGASYRVDSFVHKRTIWKYTLDWACILRTCFEVGRRHKILNPEKMRSAHGMLMCILMDSEHPQIAAQTGFSCVRPMRTAFGLSASTELLGLFEDPDLLVASRPVLPWERDQRIQKSGRGAEELALQAKEKAEARRRLVARHGTGGLSSEVSLLVDSVADSIVYREISTRPIRRMIWLLKHHWRPDRLDDPPRKNVSLAIQAPEFGARLSHSHKTQFYFVLQSLSLWLEIVDHMLDLWAAGEKDMLDEHNQYNLTNTGQGLQRLQGASRVGKRMREYQARINKATGHPWVGSAVVHLGDHCVPNALTFLDKYSQVPWILNPILQALDYLSELDKGSDPAVLGYIKARWGTVEYAQRYILRNFFRFGFDGSGGDNNYDAGSCVDGRLTSAWNWCSKLEKKSFLNVFMLSGFTGFDGDFSR